IQTTRLLVLQRSFFASCQAHFGKMSKTASQSQPSTAILSPNIDDDPTPINSELASYTPSLKDGKANTRDLEKAAAAVSAVDAMPVPPPDGGIQAWTRVFGAHCVVMCTWYVCARIYQWCQLC